MRNTSSTDLDNIYNIQANSALTQNALTSDKNQYQITIQSMSKILEFYQSQGKNVISLKCLDKLTLKSQQIKLLRMT